MLLACPQAAASPWVNREVAHWCDTKGTDQLLLVWTDGVLAWDEALGDFTATSDAVPVALRGRYVSEPLYLDVRWARETPELSLQLFEFRAAVAQVAGPIRNVPPDELVGEDIRLHRRARRLARAAVVGLAALTVVALVAASVAVANSHRADRRTREAIGRQVGLAALDAPAGQLDQALLMSLVSASLANPDDPSRYQSTQMLIGKYSRLERVLQFGAQDDVISVRDLAVSPDATSVSATVTTANDVALAHWDTRFASDLVALPRGVGDRLVLLGDGGQVVVGAGSSEWAQRTPDGELVRESGELLALNRWAQRGWVLEEQGRIALVGFDGAKSLANFAGDATAAVDIGLQRAAIAAVGRVVVLDTRTGAELASANAAPGAQRTAVGASDTAAVVQTTADGNMLRWTLDGRTLSVAQSVALPDQLGQPSWLAVAPNGQHALVVGAAGRALVDFERGTAVLVPGDDATTIELDPSGRFVALGGTRLGVWDLNSGQRLIAVAQVTNALAWSGPCDQPVPCKLAVSGVSIDVFDPVADTQVRIADDVGATAIALSSDGTHVVSGGWGGSVNVWNVTPAVDNSARTAIAPVAVTDVRARLEPSCRAEVTATSPNQAFVAAVDPNTFVLASCPTADPKRVVAGGLPQDLGRVTAIAVDDQGAVVLGRDGGFVEFYARTADGFQPGRAIDVRAGGELTTVTALAIRNNVVVAGVRSPAPNAPPARVLVWQLDRGQPIAFSADFSDVVRVAFVDEQATVLIVAARNEPQGAVTIQLWETDSRRRVGRALSGLRGGIVSLVGLGTAIEAVDAQGQAFRWTLDRDPTSDVCSIVGRALRRDEWNAMAGGAISGYPFASPCR